MTNDKIIIALDVDTIKEEEKLLDLLSPYVKIFKIGMELFYSCGPKAVEIVKKYDRDVFLDLKFHDIPNTVRSSASIAVRLGVLMFNVHSVSGIEMMKTALESAEEESEKIGIDRPRILGVTVLTSMDETALAEIGINTSIQQQVLRLTGLVKKAGLDGVVASSQEAGVIRKEFGRDFLIVTPGIRLEHDQKQDQKRTSSPKHAIHSGADYIVIGRPVTKAKDPIKAIEAIISDV